MSRRGLSIAARLAIGAAVPVVLTSAVLGWLSVTELDRQGARQRALIGELGGASAPPSEAPGDAARDRMVLRIAGVGLLCALAGGAAGCLQGRALAHRIRPLVAASEAFVAGKPVARAADRVGDELTVLGDSIDFMTEHLATVVGRARERAQFDAEKVVTAAVQGAILPAAGELSRPGFQVAGTLRPAVPCSGDFWSYYPLDEHRTMVVVGGATGHGIDAVLVAAAAKSACDAVRTARGAAVTPADVLEAMNAAVFQQARRRQVMTCFASVVDLGRGAVVHANAGHPFAYLFRGRGEDGEFSPLTSRGNRLGEVADARYETLEVALTPGDTLIWYTDGVLECQNADGEGLGDRRFRLAIRRAMQPDAVNVRERVIGECLAFYGAIPPKDDITMVIGRVT
jgi:phosphoserine phosphatase RsbU/P